MNAGKTIGRLKALKKAILADGKVDWNETEQLLEVVRPLAKRHGFVFQDYERLLEKCRADGQITGEESKNWPRTAFAASSFIRSASSSGSTSRRWTRCGTRWRRQGSSPMLHAGSERVFDPPYHSSPREVAELSRRFPHLKIAAAHLGGFRMWDETECALCGADVYLDLSHALLWMPDEQLMRIVRRHGRRLVLTRTTIALQRPMLRNVLPDGRRRCRKKGTGSRQEGRGKRTDEDSIWRSRMWGARRLRPAVACSACIRTSFSWVSRADFAAAIDRARNDPFRAKELQGILHHTGHLLKNLRITPAPNDWTTTVLYRLGFRWRPADGEYLASFLRMLDELAVFG